MGSYLTYLLKVMKIYTANTNNYDRPREDIQVFTDNSLFQNPVRNARFFKILPPFDGEDTLWLDANITLKEDLDSFIEWFCPEGYDMAVWEHPFRDCVYDEAAEILRYDHPKYRQCHDDVRRQVQWLQSMGYPKDNGLAETNVLFRRHSREMVKFNNEWFAQLSRFSHRDQLSFNPALETTNLRVKYHNYNVREHISFYYEQH